MYMGFFKAFGIKVKLWWLRGRVRAVGKALEKADRLRGILDGRLSGLQERIRRLEERRRRLREAL